MKRAGIWIKICGTTSLSDARWAVEAGASALGFVFAASPRRVDPKTAADIVSGLEGEVESVGVFVNETAERIAEIAEQVGLSGVQLQGDEDSARAAEIRRRLPQLKLIKAIQGNALANKPQFEVESWVTGKSELDAVLLDSGSPQRRGGTGATFDWEQAAPLAARIRERVPLIIAGGLHAGNVAEAIALFEPWGVDVVSGIESEPGIKDVKKLQEFVAAVRQSG